MTGMNRNIVLGCLMGATALVSPAVAQAASGSPSHEQMMEARLQKLEAELAVMRDELASARTQQAQTAESAQAAVTRSTEAAAKVARLETRPQAEGMRSGATTLKIGGFLKVVGTRSRFSDGEVTTNSLGRDFYLPQAIPTGGARASTVQDFTAKQSRFWLNLTTDVAGHTLKGYVETDFQTSAGAQGSQRTTNGYNLALRRAYIQIDKWTFGQDWTTFQYTGALPESTDFVGATEGTIFVRQPLIRYSTPLGAGTTLHLAVEEPEAATTLQGNSTLIENGDDKMPDFAARLAWAGKAGELSFAGLARQLRVDNAGVSADRFGWGVSAAGKLFLSADKAADVRFMVTYGRGIGRYVGLNFGPDAVFVPGTGTLEDVGVFAALGAVRVPIVPDVRVNLMGSYQTLDYADALSAVSLAGFNKTAWSGAVNLFWSPVKPIDLGIEYRHGERSLVSGAKGSLDRLEFAAKYTF